MFTVPSFWTRIVILVDANPTLIAIDSNLTLTGSLPLDIEA